MVLIRDESVIEFRLEERDINVPKGKEKAARFLCPARTR